MRATISACCIMETLLCCIDYNSSTAVGNVRASTLREVLSSEAVGRIVEGFRRMRVVHPIAKKCLGSSSFSSWLFRPAMDAMVLRLLGSTAVFSLLM